MRRAKKYTCVYLSGGWREPFDCAENAALRLHEYTYGLKQVTMAFWKQLLEYMRDIDKKNEHSRPLPLLPMDRTWVSYNCVLDR